MRIRAISAAVAFSVALLTAACQNQPQQPAPQNSHAAAQTAAPVAPAGAPQPAPKAIPVFVASTAPATPRPSPSPAPSAIQDQSDRGITQALAQSDESFVLQGTARATLESALSKASGLGPVLLPAETTTALMEGVSEELRSSCNGMLSGWGEHVSGTESWTARVLYSLRRPDRPDVTQAVLALRCGSTEQSASGVQGADQYFDERPAILSITPETATVKLVPVASNQASEETLYGVEFSQAFTAAGAQLIELSVHHTTNNPSSAGPEDDNGNRLMAFDLSSGKQVFAADENVDNDSEDDELPEGGTHTVCDTKLSYQRDAAGNVESISSETHCKVNDKPQPEIKRQLFLWNSDLHQFTEVK
jgi:hypothetical protein